MAAVDTSVALHTAEVVGDAGADRGASTAATVLESEIDERWKRRRKSPKRETESDTYKRGEYISLRINEVYVNH
ncbi:hypothetical protein E3N88_04233 [Mikania micrantha]|uniref:Uncharacterized protein n=1 Tax=Mikania micrantha TaxID=192012 RepID=A0A5N6PTV1_9ASTR|nr:hypothetical protein E3N88_04233 [Mikania micrantha]